MVDSLVYQALFWPLVLDMELWTKLTEAPVLMGRVLQLAASDTAA